MNTLAVQQFIRELDASKTPYALTSVREGAVMVIVALPGERWEIEFFDDREPEVEVFRSDGASSASRSLPSFGANQPDNVRFPPIAEVRPLGQRSWMRVTAGLALALFSSACSGETPCDADPQFADLIASATKVVKPRWPNYASAEFCPRVEPLAGGRLITFEPRSGRRHVGGGPELLFSGTGELLDVGASQ